MAEVLITLGIIGVVAALTLPTLIQNHQKQTYVTQLKKFMSTFEQSLQMAMADDGVDDLRNTDLFKDGFYGHKGEVENQQFVSKFKKYLKIEIKNVSDEQASTFTCGAFSEYFFIPDGVIVTNFIGGGLINDSTNCATIKNLGGHMCAAVASLQVDVNGFKGPNVSGRDRFNFKINERGRLVSYGSRDCSMYELLDERFMWDKTSDNARKCDANGGGGCAARIIDEGWKMNY